MAVDTNKAKSVLEQALIESKKIDNLSEVKFKQFLDSVLTSDHKTYKYILFTALLSKSVDPSINMLCLQAGSKLSGAYDARSVCHSVVVPFEMNSLGRALGGSNEPFLNKPARATELSKSNPVRKGKDKVLLDSLCDNLPLIDSKHAYISLIYVINRLLEKSHEFNSYYKIKQNIANYNIKEKTANNIHILKKFVLEVASETFEGESLALMVGGLLTLYMETITDDYAVLVHPVNQCGASSKEISDIDVYKDNKLHLTSELKDKTFHNTDVQHAVRKVLESGFHKIIFIKGYNGKLSDGSEKDLEEQMMDEGCHLKFINIEDFTGFILSFIENPNIEVFYKSVIKTALEKKFKESTIRMIRIKAQKYGWIE